MNDAELDALLGELPTTAPVPPELDAAVLDGIQAAPPRRSWAPLAVAAAIVLSLGIGALTGGALRSPPTLVLTAGTQLVDGRALVLAGDREVAVSGRARISVEPPGGLAREGGQEATEAMLDKTHALAALAGSLVTVAVYQGSATISGPETEPITVDAGEQKTVGTPAPAPQVRRVVRAAPSPEPAVQVRLDGDADPEAVIAALQAELATLRTQQSLAEGQLAAVQGEPEPWPDDVPDAFRPAAFERALRTAVEEEGAGDVLVVDCSEFPCLTVLKPAPYDGQGTSPEVQAVIDRLSEALGDAGIGVYNSKTGDGVNDLLLSGLAFTPADARDDDLATRSSWRMEGHLKGLSEDLMGQTEDEDVDQQ